MTKKSLSPEIKLLIEYILTSYPYVLFAYIINLTIWPIYKPFYYLINWSSFSWVVIILTLAVFCNYRLAKKSRLNELGAKKLLLIFVKVLAVEALVIFLLWIKMEFLIAFSTVAGLSLLLIGANKIISGWIALILFICSMFFLASGNIAFAENMAISSYIFVLISLASELQSIQ